MNTEAINADTKSFQQSEANDHIIQADLTPLFLDPVPPPPVLSPEEGNRASSRNVGFN
jgi:hypothetical protein